MSGSYATLRFKFSVLRDYVSTDRRVSQIWQLFRPTTLFNVNYIIFNAFLLKWQWGHEL